MHTPGAAIVCATSELETAKLLKSANVSSTSVRQVGDAVPPGRPSKSAIAVTVRTSSYAAGTLVAKSLLSFPAPTTYVIPLTTELQIATWSASLFVWPQLPSSAEFWKRRLMLATLMPVTAAFAVTQSMPQMTVESVPEPCESSTRTE